MNDIQIFDNPEFGEVRVVMMNDEPWFVGRDVTDALGYSNPRKALADHVDEEDKGVTKCDTLGGQQNVTVINESGIYSLILSSKLPTAKAFKRWVTAEVLPTMRKTGGYVSSESLFVETYLPGASADVKKIFSLTLHSLREANAQVEKLSAKIEADAPDVNFAQAIKGGDGDMLVMDFAKVLQNAGYKIGPLALYAKLRDMRYLCSRGESYNMPTERCIEAGWMRIRESPVVKADGATKVYKTPLITPKGQHYFLNVFTRPGYYRRKDGGLS